MAEATVNADAKKQFWAKVRMSLFCWEWTAAKDGHGYGVQRIGGKNILAPRVSWMIHFGPIPDGLCVLHRCDNPLCVNPAHLFLGTKLDNMRDMIGKGRARHDVTPRGEAHPQARLTVDQVREIRRRVSAGESRKAVAVDLGVDKTTVAKIVSGRLWATVPMDEPKIAGGGKPQ